MPLDAARLRKLADELEAEEADARRELEEAETKTERQELRERLEALEQANNDLQARLEEKGKATEAEEAEEDLDEEEAETEARPKMRKGRKHGMIYQDRPGEAGYVYQGDDEDDLVPVEEDAA